MTNSITTERKFLAERAVSVKASIRTRMLELASTFDDVIPLGRGDPDFDTPPVIVDAGITALKDGLHHYTVPVGMPELRTEICKKLKRDNQLDYSPNQIIVCNGCQEALFISIMTLVNPGDEVILQEPRFNSFDYMVNLAGGSVVSIPTRESENFSLLAKDIRRVITDKTKLLIVANPNNPTGSLIERSDMLEIAELAVEKDIAVLSDEIYEKIIFDEGEHCSLAPLVGMYDRTVTINGLSKSYAMTGWRVGYLAAPLWFMEPASEIKHAMSICTAPAMQKAALVALKDGEHDVARMTKIYQQRRNLITKGLDQMGLTYGHPGGGMYIYANVSSTGVDAENFCYELLKQEHVLVFPGTLFADTNNQHIRLTLLSPENTISEALVRLERFTKNIKDDKSS